MAGLCQFPLSSPLRESISQAWIDKLSGHPTGSRTRLSTLKGWCPRPSIDDGTIEVTSRFPVRQDCPFPVLSPFSHSDSRRISTLVCPRRTKGGPVLWGMTPQSNSSLQLRSQPSKLLYTIRDQRFNGESELRLFFLQFEDKLCTRH